MDRLLSYGSALRVADKPDQMFHRKKEGSETNPMVGFAGFPNGVGVGRRRWSVFESRSLYIITYRTASTLQISVNPYKYYFHIYIL